MTEQSNLFKERLVRKVSGKKEKKLSDRIGARLHKNSGAGLIKNDMSTDSFLIEHKYTVVKQNYTIYNSVWQQLKKNAHKMGKEPMLVIEVNGEELAVVNFEMIKGFVGG